MRKSENIRGIKIGGDNFSNIKYADGTLLIADDERHLQNLIDDVTVHGKQSGIELNCNKMEVVVVSEEEIYTRM